ncbi:hypothetical protein P7M41_25935 [Vibrio parahaemolyticus]|nr:hypothetical protein [Vibrio parahaemolyticus]
MEKKKKKSNIQPFFSSRFFGDLECNTNPIRLSKEVIWSDCCMNCLKKFHSKSENRDIIIAMGYLKWTKVFFTGELRENSYHVIKKENISDKEIESLTCNEWRPIILLEHRRLNSFNNVTQNNDKIDFIDVK